MPPIQFYQKPYYGQQFRRKQNQTDYQDGAIVGLHVRGGTFKRDGIEVEDWSATIQYGQQEYAYINARTPIVSGADQWLPVPDEEVLSRFGPGYEALRQRVDVLQGVLTQVAGQVDVLAERVMLLAETASAGPPAQVEALHLVGEPSAEAPVEVAPSNPVRRRRGTG
jgi:hypothetical protein